MITIVILMMMMRSAWRLGHALLARRRPALHASAHYGAHPLCSPQARTARESALAAAIESAGRAEVDFTARERPLLEASAVAGAELEACVAVIATIQSDSLRGPMALLHAFLEQVMWPLMTSDGPFACIPRAGDGH
jgi:hypothetical protein